MKELIEALTRAANAVAAHYEGKPVSQTRPVNELDRRAAEAAPEKEAETAPKKSRAKKSPEAAPAESAVGLDAAEPAAKKDKGMTEDESAKATTDVAKLLVSKFSKPVAPDNKPEGFHIAKKILIEGFRVGRLSDLSHEQRVDFIAQVKDILTNGVPAAA